MAASIAAVVSSQAAAGREFAYVANSIGGFVDTLDVTGNSIIRRSAIRNFPRGLAITPDGRFAYAARSGARGLVSVVSTATHDVVTSIPADDPMYITMARGGTFAIVSIPCGPKAKPVIDTSRDVVLTTVAVHRGPTGLAMTPDGQALYVANTLGGDVSVIDTQTNLVIATIGSDGWVRPSAVAFTPDGSRAFVVDDINVFVVDTATHQIIPGGPPKDTGPSAIAVDSVPEPCLGDCDADGVVTVDELIAGVNLVLGRDQSCAALYSRCSASVSVLELVAAVDNSLHGCPRDSGAGQNNGIM